MPDDPWDRVRELAGRSARLVGAVRPGERKPFGELDISMRSLVGCLHQLGRKAEARDVSRVFEVFLNTEAEAAEWRQGGPAPAVQESLLYCSDAYKRLYNAKLKLGQALQNLSIFLQPVQRQRAPTGHGVQIVPQEQPWADDAPEYLPLTEARKLIDERLSLPTLSKWLTPDGEIRYMRKKGVGCKVHVADFRRYMQSRQSETAFATALAAYFSAAGKGDVRFFWHCSRCGADYPENSSATVNCPKCKTECKLIRKPPPKPRR